MGVPDIFAPEAGWSRLRQEGLRQKFQSSFVSYRKRRQAGKDGKTGDAVVRCGTFATDVVGVCGAVPIDWALEAENLVLRQ
jgi:hypothetical protein